MPEAESPPVIHVEGLDAQRSVVAHGTANEEVTARVTVASASTFNDISASTAAATATTTPTSDTPAENGTEWLRALREELSTYRLAKLIKRATDVGVAEADIEAAGDAKNHKDALIELIIETQQSGLAVEK